MLFWHDIYSKPWGKNKLGWHNSKVWNLELSKNRNIHKIKEFKILDVLSLIFVWTTFIKQYFFFQWKYLEIIRNHGCQTIVCINHPMKLSYLVFGEIVKPRYRNVYNIPRKMLARNIEHIKELWIKVRGPRIQLI